MIKVAVTGALGKVGREVIKTVFENDKTQLVAAIDMFEIGKDIGEVLFNKKFNVLISNNIEKTFTEVKPDVVVDFTQPSIIFENAKKYINLGVSPVIGTTGLKPEQINELKNLSNNKNVSCLIAPNFSTGAVLMMKFAKEAAKYFDNAEIIELHHNQKKDAPSGTAIKTAELMAEVNDNFTTGNCNETETIQGARGAKTKSEIHIHSVRMPGYSASQEVIFGSSGQILTIKHDTSDRACYMKGVMLAIEHVYNNKDFVYGLDNIM
ncbi:4-hydroxy-tetrahydrodipicolinate reductase [bacterium]|nr:4-hydroxy-tetrahydrodipicolinate reductase [bacterium]